MPPDAPRRIVPESTRIRVEVINATKTQPSLFSTSGLSFGDSFALLDNIGQTFTYNGGKFDCTTINFDNPAQSSPLALARAAANGLLAEGVLPVLKHIPGHGRATADSHVGLPVVEADRAALEASDFAAYLASLPPKGDYPALQKALAELRSKRAATSFTPLPSGDLLRPGMTDVRVSILRKRLGT